MLSQRSLSEHERMCLPCSCAAKSSAHSAPYKVGYYVLIEDSVTFLCIIG
jgi:hypothetical protein